jgi:hypothetical protein
VKKLRLWELHCDNQATRLGRNMKASTSSFGEGLSTDIPKSRSKCAVAIFRFSKDVVLCARRNRSRAGTKRELATPKSPPQILPETSSKKRLPGAGDRENLLGRGGRRVRVFCSKREELMVLIRAHRPVALAGTSLHSLEFGTANRVRPSPSRLATGTRCSADATNAIGSTGPSPDST